jgi:hypothetical protein
MVENLINEINISHLKKRLEDEINRYENALISLDHELYLGDRTNAEIHLPFFSKYYVRFIRDHLNNMDELDSIIELKCSNLDSKMKNIENVMGDAYCKSLLKSLDEDLNKYSSLVFHGFIDFYDESGETMYDLYRREIIEIKIMELEDLNYDIHEIKSKIVSIDNKLKAEFLEAHDFIIKNKLDDYYEKSYYPDRFWFYHPKKLFEEIEK